MHPTQQRLKQFREWIEKWDFYFWPIQFKNGLIYRWVNENCSHQFTTRELYNLFLELEQD